MKKAYEVVMSVPYGSKDQSRIIFVEASHKRDIVNADGVIRVFTRPDMKPEDCPCKLFDGTIITK